MKRAPGPFEMQVPAPGERGGELWGVVAWGLLGSSGSGRASCIWPSFFERSPSPGLWGFDLNTVVSG